MKIHLNIYLNKNKICKLNYIHDNNDLKLNKNNDDDHAY